MFPVTNLPYSGRATKVQIALYTITPKFISNQERHLLAYNMAPAVVFISWLLAVDKQLLGSEGKARGMNIRNVSDKSCVSTHKSGVHSM